MMMENPLVPCKRKHIQPITDYCLDNKVEFTIRPGEKDEFETEFHIADITSAVALGMFLRENRLFLKGMEPASPKSKKAEKEKAKEESTPEAEQKDPFQYEENGLQFDMADTQ